MFDGAVARAHLRGHLASNDEPMAGWHPWEMLLAMRSLSAPEDVASMEQLGMVAGICGSFSGCYEGESAGVGCQAVPLGNP